MKLHGQSNGFSGIYIIPISEQKRESQLPYKLGITLQQLKYSHLSPRVSDEMARPANCGSEFLFNPYGLKVL